MRNPYRIEFLTNGGVGTYAEVSFEDPSSPSVIGRRLAVPLRNCLGCSGVLFQSRGRVWEAPVTEDIWSTLDATVSRIVAIDSEIFSSRTGHLLESPERRAVVK